MDKNEFKNRLRMVEQILQSWDPLGVIESLIEDGLPPNEYDSYAPAVCQLLLNNKSEQEIAEHLATIERVQMGFEGASWQAKHNRDIAAQLKQFWILRT